MSSNRRILAIGGGIAALLVIYVVSGFFTVMQRLRIDDKQIEDKAVKLLYHTNHQDLLDACDQLRRDRDKIRHDPSWSGGPNDHTHLDPSDPLVPELIRSLDAKSLTVVDRYVIVEMGGGGYHAGVYAFPTTSAVVPLTGSKQLLPRLYFSSDAPIPPKR